MTKPHVAIAVPVPIAELFTYEWPFDTPPVQGMRCLVPFGRRHLVGVVWEELEPSLWQGKGLKSVAKLVDDQPFFRHSLIQLIQFMSQYYCHPIGEVVKGAMPAATSHAGGKKKVCLTALGGRELAEQTPMGLELKKTFGQRASLTLSTLKKKNIDLKPLLKGGYVETSSEEAWSVRTFVGNKSGGEPLVVGDKPVLTHEQLEVYQGLNQKVIEGKGTGLLHGVTGSGKTEIFLHLIEEVLNRDLSDQVLVMVPEIALTPQMTRVFSQRFPGRVAVVHSQLTPKKRWEELAKISSGSASVLIGPRSALFAPFSRLKLLIVDEEHDSSYKQTSGLCYHSRDMAVLLGTFEGSFVLLASATPSLESYHHARTGKYAYFPLTSRAVSKSLPKIHLLAMKPEKKYGTAIGAVEEAHIPLSSEVVAAIHETLARQEQVIILVNKRGYSYFLFDMEKKEALQCPQCRISLTLHQRNRVLICHSCDHYRWVSDLDPAHKNRYLAVGYGSQQAEAYLGQLFPKAAIARLDSDNAAHRDTLYQTLEQFRQGEIDILVGTQILAKGHDYPRVTLTVLLEVDQILNLPDFRAGERTFQLMVQAAGRSGRGDQPGRVLVQSMQSSHPVVQAGVEQNFPLFAERELALRRSIGYPPFGRLVTIEWSSPKRESVEGLMKAAEQWVERREEWAKRWVQVFGPAVPGVDFLKGQHRRMVSFLSTQVQPLHKISQDFMTQFGSRRELRFKIDVDPQSMI